MKYCSGNNMWWKRDYNSDLRSKVKQAIHVFDPANEDTDLMLPLQKEVSEVWAAPSDGMACYWNDLTISAICRDVTSCIKASLNGAAGNYSYNYSYMKDIFTILESKGLDKKIVNFDQITDEDIKKFAIKEYKIRFSR